MADIILLAILFLVLECLQEEEEEVIYIYYILNSCVRLLNIGFMKGDIYLITRRGSPSKPKVLVTCPGCK